MAQHGCRFAVPAMKKGSQKALLSRVFCDPGNPVSAYVNKTAGVDKALKASIAAAELTKGVILQQGGSEASLATASNVLGILKDARTVVGLTNALNGCIPGAVASVKSCYQNFRYAFAGESQGVVDERNEGKAYNKQYLTRGEYLAAAVKSGCDAVGAGTFAITFGTLRPTLLADRLTHGGLICRQTKAGVTAACDYLMVANHAAGVVGGSIGLGLENRQFSRAMASLELHANSFAERVVSLDEKELLQQDVEALKAAHHKAIKKGICGVIEKSLELFLDALKLIAFPITQPITLIVRGAVGLAIGGLGMYKVWSSDQ